MRTLFFPSLLLALSLNSFGEMGRCDGADCAPHPNGGGFVAATAWVSEYAYISVNASVCDHAWVSDGAQVYGDAMISGHTRIYGKNVRIYDFANVLGYAQVGDDVHIFGFARISGHAHVGNGAHIFGLAQITGDALIFGDDIRIASGLYNGKGPIEWWMRVSRD